MSIAAELKDPDRFSKWFLSEKFADIRFVIKDHKVIPGHRVVVATESEKLVALADSEGTIRLMDTDEETLKRALTFVYKAYLDLQSTDKPAMSLLTFSKKYAMDRLYQAVARYVRKELTSTSALLWLPHLGEFPDFYYRVWNLIDADADEALSSANFTLASEETVLLLVKRATLDVDEFSLFERIQHWATAKHERNASDNAEDAGITIRRLIKLLRFAEMTIEQFENGPARFLAYDELQSVRNWICNGDTKPEWCIDQPRLQRGRHQIVSCHKWNTKNRDGYHSVGVTFAVDKPILLAGIGVTTAGPYGFIDVTTTLVAAGVTIVTQRSEVDLGYLMHSAFIKFVDLITIAPDVEYTLQVVIHPKNDDETFCSSVDTLKPMVTWKVSKSNVVTIRLRRVDDENVGPCLCLYAHGFIPRARKPALKSHRAFAIPSLCKNVFARLSTKDPSNKQ